MTGGKAGTLGGGKQGAFLTASMSSVKFIAGHELGVTGWHSDEKPKKGKEYMRAGSVAVPLRSLVIKCKRPARPRASSTTCSCSAAHVSRQRARRQHGRAAAKQQGGEEKVMSPRFSKPSWGAPLTQSESQNPCTSPPWL